MMAYHNPIPEKKRPGEPGADAQGKGASGGMSGMMGAWVQAEKLMQIALMLPSAAFIGWLAGYCLDRWLHQTWIGTFGAIFGIIAGLVGAVRMAIFFGSKDGNPNGNGNQGDSKSGQP